jgi:hypothetical protein
MIAAGVLQQTIVKRRWSVHCFCWLRVNIRKMLRMTHESGCGVAGPDSRGGIEDGSKLWQHGSNAESLELLANSLHGYLNRRYSHDATEHIGNFQLFLPEAFATIAGTSVHKVLSWSLGSMLTTPQMLQIGASMCTNEIAHRSHL